MSAVLRDHHKHESSSARFLVYAARWNAPRSTPGSHPRVKQAHGVGFAYQVLRKVYPENITITDSAIVRSRNGSSISFDPLGGVERLG
jgi:hypothetical protein